MEGGILDIFTEIIARISIFFDSINGSLKSTNVSRTRIIRFAINMGYAIAISALLGLIMQIFSFVFIVAFTGWDIVGEINLWVMPLFLLLCFTEINLFNYKIGNFSLPKKVLHLYVILKNISIFDGIWKTIGFSLINSMILMLLFGWMLSPFKMPDGVLPMVMLIIGIIALLITMVIYHEATANEMNRKRKQFLIAMIVFVGYLVLNIYQMGKVLNSEWNNSTITIYSTTILGLLLSIITVIDKARDFYRIAKGTYKDEIDEIEKKLYEKYSYKKGIKVINEQKSDLRQSFNNMRIIWTLGSRKEKRNILLYMIACVIFLFFAFYFIWGIPEDKILGAIEYVKKFIIDSIFDGNTELAVIILVLLITAAFIVRFTYYFIRNFRVSNIIYKSQLICKIELCLIILISCSKDIVPIVYIFLVKYLLMPLCLLFLVSLMVLSVLVRKESKEKTN